MADQKEKKVVDVNETEQKVEETKAEEKKEEAAPEPVKTEEKKEEKKTETIEVNPHLAKFLRGAKKVARVAIPIGVGIGGVILGVNIGANEERKKNAGELNAAKNQISDLQLKLEQRKSDYVPSLTTTVDSTPVLEPVEVPMNVIE